MTIKCNAPEMRDMLPDLLHGTLTTREKSRVEAHAATCPSCREELKVLRTVRAAAVFAPVVNVDAVVRQIPPYQAYIPAAEPAAVRQSARPRLWAMLAAAGVALVVAAGGSLLLYGEREEKLPAVVQSAPSESPALALVAGVDGLTDGTLVQLMNEMDGFDVLPASDPETLLSVDTTDGI